MPTSAAEAEQFLTQQHKWPEGLAHSLLDGLRETPMRFFILDDSGSMASRDGHLFDKTTNKYKSCSRFEELIDSMRFHAELAQRANVLTEFRLLNGHPPLVIGNDTEPLQSEANYRLLQSTVFKSSPRGGTPLCRHIAEVCKSIRTAEATLRSHRHKAVVVIATDGESSDGNVSSALEPLRHLPVWVVIRLCTDSDSIVRYWNKVDEDLELDMEVLDDFQSEAESVHSFNSWLTYGLPLHRFREFGCTASEFDLLNERALTPDEMTKVCAFILGGSRSAYANLTDDSTTALLLDQPWPEALASPTSVNATVQTFCPVMEKYRPWIHRLDPPGTSRKQKKNTFDRTAFGIFAFIFILFLLVVSGLK